MQSDSNPAILSIQPTGRVRKDKLYVRRRADDLLFSALSDGKYCHVLAPRQVGKTSLCDRVSARLVEKAKARCLYIDLTRLGGFSENETAERWFGSLFFIMGEELSISAVTIEQFINRVHYRTLAAQWQCFLREIVLVNCTEERVVLFFDEIDIVLSLPYSVDEFFLVLRSIYNSREHDPTHERLAVCFLGVARPTDLVRHPERTPFNLAEGIDLDDFTHAEFQKYSASLGQLSLEDDDRDSLMEAIWRWAAGHPYMSSTICSALLEHKDKISHGNYKQILDNIVNEKFIQSGIETDHNLAYAHKRIEHWRTATSQPQLRTEKLLHLYRRVLEGRQISAQRGDVQQNELRLCGLCRWHEGHLTVRNEIIREVFNKAWLERQIVKSDVEAAVAKWDNAGRPTALLFKGEKLRKALVWATGREVSTECQDFLTASRAANQRSLFWRRAPFVGAVGLLLSVAAVLCIQASRFRQEARDSLIQVRNTEQSTKKLLADIELQNRNLSAHYADLELVTAQYKELISKRSEDNEKLFTLLEKATTLLSDSRQREMALTDLIYKTTDNIQELVKRRGLTDGKQFQRELALNQQRLSDLMKAQRSGFQAIDATISELKRSMAAKPVDLGAHGAVEHLTLSSKPMGDPVMAAASRDGTVTFLNGRDKLQEMKFDHRLVDLHISPDAERLAVVEENGSAWLIKLPLARSKQVRIALGTVKDSRLIRFSPDGSRMVSVSKSGLSIFEPNNGRVLHRIPIDGRNVETLVFSHDGKRLALGGSQADVSVYELAGKRPIVIPLPKIRASFLDFRDEIGHALFGCSGTGRTMLLNLSLPISEEQVQDGIRLEGRCLAAAQTSGGYVVATERAAAGSAKIELVLWRVQDGQELWKQPVPKTVNAAVFSADTMKLISGGDDAMVRTDWPPIQWHH